MIRNVVKGLKLIQMGINIKENILRGPSMARDSIVGRMEKSMMVNGLRGRNKGLVYGRVLEGISIWENGMRVSLMGLVCMCG